LLATVVERQASAGTAAPARKLSAVERANEKLVREFYASWGRADLDIDKLLLQYIAPNAPVRWFDSEPAALGPEAAAGAAKKGAADNFRVSIDILEVFARGPLVATSRVDTIMAPGKPDQVFKAVGVCIVKDRQFHEYCDYILT
jgi:limonene-1,2-epoxide hydrolase